MNIAEKQMIEANLQFLFQYHAETIILCVLRLLAFDVVGLLTFEQAQTRIHPQKSRKLSLYPKFYHIEETYTEPRLVRLCCPCSTG